MHANARLITDFYEAFQRKDHQAMRALYHPDAHFTDPAFPDLRGWRIGAMWQMLCENGKDLVIEFSDVSADDATGEAHWEPVYSFGPAGRRVHNIIDASFEFKDGKVIRHIDHFNMWKWSRQALGPMGWLLGWTPVVPGKVQGQAGRGLEKFIEKNGLAPTG